MKQRMTRCETAAAVVVGATVHSDGTQIKRVAVAPGGVEQRESAAGPKSRSSRRRTDGWLNVTYLPPRRAHPAAAAAVTSSRLKKLIFTLLIFMHSLSNSPTGKSIV